MSEDPVEARARSRIGRLLRDKWKLERLLGVGGMAAVYAATHRNGSKAAVKVLHLELSLDPKMRERFLREGYVANTVDHPGAVRVLDDDRDDDGSVFLVMELLDGESLEARQARLGGHLPPEEALLLMDQLLAVLAAAHARGIVHRDIKPENLFLRTDSELKLLDFGIARLRDNSASATRTGMTMGTPAFMAPEQALGQSERIGPPSDLWAVGATLFSLLRPLHRWSPSWPAPSHLTLQSAGRTPWPCSRPSARPTTRSPVRLFRWSARGSR
ncbi:MAG: serine/threonine protein kinase [Polyangiaceae bacterium]|nr:serine/threonine protein kinase [Polyangiaceae bacterium]